MIHELRLQRKFWKLYWVLLSKHLFKQIHVIIRSMIYTSRPSEVSILNILDSFRCISITYKLYLVTPGCLLTTKLRTGHTVLYHHYFIINLTFNYKCNFHLRTTSTGLSIIKFQITNSMRPYKACNVFRDILYCRVLPAL